MVQYSQINKCNTSHKQKERQKSHDHINRCRKAFDKVQQPFMIKNTQQSGSGGSIPQHNKGYIQEIYSQHHTQWAKT